MFAARLQDCRLVNLGPGAHYRQEDHAEAIGHEVYTWLADKSLTCQRSDTAYLRRCLH